MAVSVLGSENVTIGSGSSSDGSLAKTGVQISTTKRKEVANDALRRDQTQTLIRWRVSHDIVQGIYPAAAYNLFGSARSHLDLQKFVLELLAANCKYFFGGENQWRKLFTSCREQHRDDAEIAALSLLCKRDVQIFRETENGCALVCDLKNPDSSELPPIRILRQETSYDALVPFPVCAICPTVKSTHASTKKIPDGVENKQILPTPPLRHSRLAYAKTPPRPCNMPRQKHEQQGIDVLATLACSMPRKRSREESEATHVIVFAQFMDCRTKRGRIKLRHEQLDTNILAECSSENKKYFTELHLVRQSCGRAKLHTVCKCGLKREFVWRRAVRHGISITYASVGKCDCNYPQTSKQCLCFCGALFSTLTTMFQCPCFGQLGDAFRDFPEYAQFAPKRCLCPIKPARCACLCKQSMQDRCIL